MSDWISSCDLIYLIGFAPAANPMKHFFFTCEIFPVFAVKLGHFY